MNGSNRSLKTIGAVMVALTAIGWQGQASAQPAPSVFLNGQPLATAVPPVEQGGRTLVPMRDIFEALGARVQWHDDTQGIAAYRGDTKIWMVIGDHEAKVNGQPVSLDQPPILFNHSTMVPLRFVAEALGAQVAWNDYQQAVTITAPLGGPPPMAENPVPEHHAVLDQRAVSVPPGAVVPVTLDQGLSSASAQVGQPFSATIITRQLGDSEFPPGTKLQGIVFEARPRLEGNPGILDLDFNSAVLPGGGPTIPLSGQIVGLGRHTITTDPNGRLVALPVAPGSDRLKFVGIGNPNGYAIGRVLRANNGVTAVVGASGGFMFTRDRDHGRASEATVPPGTQFGVVLTAPATYPDPLDYSDARRGYLAANVSQNGQDPFDMGPHRPHAFGAQAGGPSYPPNPGQNVASYRMITVPPDAVVPVTLDSKLSSGFSRVGDIFTTTVITQNIGDSEFPPGSKIEGRVTQSIPRDSHNAGILDVHLVAVILPDGTRVKMHADLVGLDSKSVATNGQGRLVATAPRSQSTADTLKFVGIGAAAGYALGRAFHTNKTDATVLGGVAGFLFGRHHDSGPADAVVKAGTRIGIRLDEPVTYPDTTNYLGYRAHYLHM